MGPHALRSTQATSSRVRCSPSRVFRVVCQIKCVNWPGWPAYRKIFNVGFLIVDVSQFTFDVVATEPSTACQVFQGKCSSGYLLTSGCLLAGRHKLLRRLGRSKDCERMGMLF